VSQEDRDPVATLKSNKLARALLTPFQKAKSYDTEGGTGDKWRDFPKKLG
jgi:hypothetical protein